MIDQPPLVGDRFGQLLDAMPRISDAVNAFKSPEVQQTALEALLQEFGVPLVPSGPAEADGSGLAVVPSPPGDGVAEQAHNGVAEASPAQGRAGRQRRAQRPAAAKAFTRVKDLDFWPAGKPSLRDFATEKNPGNNHEKNVVAVYYLEEILGITSITVAHVGAVYDECGWRIPGDLSNSLAKTACQKRWLDTSDYKAISVAVAGRNAILHDMPAKSAKKSA